MRPSMLDSSLIYTQATETQVSLTVWTPFYDRHVTEISQSVNSSRTDVLAGEAKREH